MQYFPDLSEYRFGLHPKLWTASGPPAERPKGLYSWQWDHGTPEPAFGLPERNIGWLDSHHEFPCGPSDQEFVAILDRLCRNTRYHLWRGSRPCLVCGELLPGHVGAAEIRVQGTGVVYAAPNLIHHYVASHSYAPPRDFVDAVGRTGARQADPVPGTKRDIPPEVLERKTVSAEDLEAGVIRCLRASSGAAEITDVSIAFAAGVYTVKATLAPGAPASAEDSVRRTWDVPEDAVLNVAQGSMGVESMLSYALNVRKEELFREGKPRLFKT